jgi:tripartite-type tricarboxylate transporter receptor subunit TctC
VVENRPGAGATLGTGQVARATPDGYTLVLSVISAMVVGKILGGERIPWDPDRDFAHVAMVMSTPYLILVRPDLPIRTPADLVPRPGGGRSRSATAPPASAPCRTSSCCASLPRPAASP